MIRYMRRTGKYWWLTILSTGATVVGSALMAAWRYPGSMELEFWVDIMPWGFGASVNRIPPVFDIILILSRVLGQVS